MRNLIPENKEVFGPIWGRIAPFLYATPLRDKALKMEAQFAFVRQWVGKAMEGGVLRKEDEIKYRTMLGQLKDPANIVEFWSKEWGKTKTREDSEETVNDVFKRRYPEVYDSLYPQK